MALPPARAPRRGSRWLCAGVVLLSALVCTAASAEVSQSANFRLTPLTVNEGGETSTSASFVMKSSVGQESTVGTSASLDFILEAGFWSFLGTRLAPVYLWVNKSVADPAHPELSWSGDPAPFKIYRSADCSALSAGFHASSGTHDWTDDDPLPDTLSCYSVTANAPGDGP
jgi:hypothetical protein